MHCQLRPPHTKRSFPANPPTPAPDLPASLPSKPIVNPTCGSLKNCFSSSACPAQTALSSVETLKAPQVPSGVGVAGLSLTIFTQCEAPTVAAASLNVS